MAGPWEKYQTAPPAAPSGPWDKYKAAPPAAPVSAAPQLGPQTTNVGQASTYALEHVNDGLASTLSLPNNIMKAIFSVGPNAVNALGIAPKLHDLMPAIFPDRPVAQPDWMNAIPDAGKSYAMTRDELMRAVGAQRLPPPNNVVDKLAASTGEAIGGALLPAVGEASVAAQPIRTLVSELATATGAGLGGGVAENAAPGNTGAELVGQIMGGGAAGLAKAGVKKAITPFPASPERTAAAATMADNGVDLSAGQKTGSKGLQYAESELGGGAAAALNDKQGEQFTQAVLGKAGINANRATPQVIDDAFNRIGSDFDQLAAKTTVPLDQQLQNDMLTVAADYQAVAGQPAKVVEDMVNRAGELAAQNGGALVGKAYQNWRSKLGEYIKRSDGPTQMALRDLQDAMDEAVERNMPPDLLPQWQQARREYKNMLVIEKAATAGGENAALGLISPAQLRQATVTQNRRAYARGTGDFNDLAHAGSATMTPLPQSGTAPRTAVRNLGTALPTLVGSGVGGGMAGLPGALAGAAAGAAVPYTLGKIIMSEPGNKYLANQVLKPRAPLDPRGGAMVGVAAPVMDAIMRGKQP